jgi:hypothetical protein
MFFSHLSYPDNIRGLISGRLGILTNPSGIFLACLFLLIGINVKFAVEMPSRALSSIT